MQRLTGVGGSGDGDATAVAFAAVAASFHFVGSVESAPTMPFAETRTSWRGGGEASSGRYGVPSRGGDCPTPARLT